MKYTMEMKEMTAIDDSIRQLVTIKDENDNLISAFNTSDKCYITADIVDGEVSWRTSDETPTSTVADRVEQDRMNFSSLLGDNTVSNYIRTRDSGVNEITYTRNGKVHKEVDLASIPKRNKKVDVPTEQWQKSVERRLITIEATLNAIAEGAGFTEEEREIITMEQEVPHISPTWTKLNVK